MCFSFNVVSCFNRKTDTLPNELPQPFGLFAFILMEIQFINSLSIILPANIREFNSFKLFSLIQNRTIRSVEEHIKESLLKEVMSMKSAKGIQIDLPTLEIKRSLDTEVLNSASFVREKVSLNKKILFYIENGFLMVDSFTFIFLGDDTIIDDV